jgi:hypothetical protein
MSVLDLGLTMGITKDSEQVPRRDELDTVSTPRSGQQATLLNLGRCLAAQHISREHACQAGARQSPLPTVELLQLAPRLDPR